MKNFLSIRTLLSVITGVLVVMLVSIFGMYVSDAFNRKRETVYTLSIVNLTRNTLSARESIRIEGGVAHAALVAPQAANADVIARMFDLRSKTDTAVISMAKQFGGHLADGTSLALTELLDSKAGYDLVFLPAVAGAKVPRCPGRNDHRRRWMTGMRLPKGLRPQWTSFRTH